MNTVFNVIFRFPLFPSNSFPSCLPNFLTSFVIIIAIHNLLSLVIIAYMYMCLDLATQYWKVILEKIIVSLQQQLLISSSSFYGDEIFQIFLYPCWYIYCFGLFKTCADTLLRVCEYNTTAISIRHYLTTDILDFWLL